MSADELDGSREAVGERIDRCIGDTKTAELVEKYFDPLGPFAGTTFDDLRPNDPMTIGVDDLLAVTLLGVHVEPSGVRRLLSDLAAQISGHLTLIEDVDLWRADDGTLAEATALWETMCSVRSIGEVTAGKLLARKRPKLVPIYDEVVSGYLQAPPGLFWSTLRTCLPTRIETIEGLRGTVPDTVSTLRLLDVAIWMTHSNGQRAQAARAASGTR